MSKFVDPTLRKKREGWGTRGLPQGRILRLESSQLFNKFSVCRVSSDEFGPGSQLEIRKLEAGRDSAPNQRKSGRIS
jgi:hypothetical protein